MQARMPTIVLEGDNQESRGLTRPFLMARNGTCMGMSEYQAIWRFGILPGSEAHHAYGICSEDFTWVLADRKTGQVISSWQGPAMNMPNAFRDIMNWGD